MHASPKIVATWARMLIAIRAEESLRRITETAAGSGLMEKHDHQRILREFRKESNLGSKGDFEQGSGKPTTLGSLLGDGFGVVMVSKNAG